MARIIGRILGWLAIVVAAATLLLMIVARFAGQGPGQPLGQLWFTVDVASLNLLQAVVERQLWPPIWDYAVFPVLQLPAIVVTVAAAVLGALLLVVTRRRGHRRRLFKN